MSLGARARQSGIYDRVEPMYSAYLRAKWVASGRPAPAPSAVKRQVIRNYGKRYGLSTLIETGTYRGDTPCALWKNFSSIETIEIEQSLYDAARRRADVRGNIVFHLGDSAELVAKIVDRLTEPSLFWLDAHFSGGPTGGSGDIPIGAEVAAVIDSPLPHVVLIDDVRLFGVDPEYPQLSPLREFAESADYSFTIETDIARLVPTEIL